MQMSKNRLYGWLKFEKNVVLGKKSKINFAAAYYHRNILTQNKYYLDRKVDPSDHYWINMQFWCTLPLIVALAIRTAKMHNDTIHHLLNQMLVTCNNFLPSWTQDETLLQISIYNQEPQVFLEEGVCFLENPPLVVT